MCMTLCLTVLIAGAQNETPPQPEKQKQKATPEEKAEKMTRRMTAKLNLTPDQVTKVTPINLDFVKKRSEIKNSELKGPEKKAQMEKLENDYFTQLATVLTPEQLETHKKNWAQMKEKRKKGRKK